MRRIRVIAVVALAAAVSVACAGRQDAAPGCAGTFSVKSAGEPLGPSSALVTAVRDRSTVAGQVSLAEVTTAAGWSNQWDRMIPVHAGAERERLNEAAGLPGFCWPDLPRHDFDAGEHPVFYVFIDGATPRQAVRATTHSPLFKTSSDTRMLQPDSLLEPVPPVQSATQTSQGYLKVVS
ncbi:hypothetical protein [Nocardia farcinica]|uniref:hypothetical protein n=1 Tax=Nocardia farcinica TaxID=37329 RepID=UPI001895AF26|nr:hypothetical protein [Nocardia farcinica]MBF6231828.1 hypothetical protein [Nocardia farcinica]